MSPLCENCGKHVNKVNQQVSVMRKEIRNLRQMLDSAVRAHRKQLASLHSALSKLELCEPEKVQKTPPQPPARLVSPQAALEQGNIQTVPIGFIRSCFSVKNGTPRQPTICGPSRAELRIEHSVFNNPEHALLGLEQFSHVWIIFLFHKNGHLSYKAKVKPPRLNGERVGVYSTRSPHRPNALGLTLAKLDRIAGDTVHLSDIDMIDGTPVLDIKPYIPDYDSPHSRRDSELYTSITDDDVLNCREDLKTGVLSREKFEDDPQVADCSTASVQFSVTEDLTSVLEEVKTFVTHGDLLSCESRDCVSDAPKIKPSELTGDRPCYGEEALSTIAGWIREPPVGSLDVRFTPLAERELAEFIPADLSGNSGSKGPKFNFLRSPEEASAAIRGVLSADPRSVYRRTRCADRLFYFTLDTADVTCWFGRGFAEVLQVRPADRHAALK